MSGEFLRPCSSMLTKLPSVLIFVPECISRIPVRTTWILKRVNELPPPHPVPQLRKPRAPLEKQKVFEVIECTHAIKKSPIPVLLTKDVGGYGKAGDVISVRRGIARMILLPEKKAVYVSNEALTAFQELRKNELADKWSSPFAETTMSFLSSRLQRIQMNAKTPWKLERWHVRAAMRRGGVWCPESAIELPKEEITGPSADMHGKCFSVFITINKKERAHMLCQLELFSKDPEFQFPQLHPVPGKPENPEPLYIGAVAPENFTKPKETEASNS